METIVRWLEIHQLPCFYKNTFGLDCPGCGAQTAFVLFLKGEFVRSFVSYPPLIFFLALFFFLALHLIFKFKNGGTYLKYIFILTAVAVFINFIVRLIQQA